MSHEYTIRSGPEVMGLNTRSPIPLGHLAAMNDVTYLLPGTLKANWKESNTFSMFTYFLILHLPYLSGLAELWPWTQLCPTSNAGGFPPSRPIPLFVPTHTLRHDFSLQICVPYPQHAMGTSPELWHFHNTQRVKLLMGQIQALSQHFHRYFLVQGISQCGFRLNPHSPEIED